MIYTHRFSTHGEDNPAFDDSQSVDQVPIESGLAVP